MRKNILFVALCFVFTNLLAQTQPVVVDKVKFFESDTTLDATLSTDIIKLLNSKTNPQYLPATFSCKLSDSTISEQIRIIARGNVRREICYLPPVKLDFHNTTSPKLYPLNSLKLVCACMQNDAYDQLILKEYLCYKIYNLLTEKSFRVRLLNLNYEDSKGKKKTVVEHAFFIEDGKEMAKRNECRQLKSVKTHSENTDHDQMTIVAIFEYMIGNTDWGISVQHNTVLIQPAKDSTARPIVIPYDFDYSGLVDADYAVPNEGLDIENVRERLYRGFPRTMDELNSAILIFNKQKENIYSLVNNFAPLNIKNKKDIIDYLDDFYKIINNPRSVQDIFIDHARKE